MNEIIKYVAFDGKEFKDKDKCIEYEEVVSSKLELYNYDGNRTTLLSDTHFMVVCSCDELSTIRDSLEQLDEDTTGLYVSPKLTNGFSTGFYWSHTFERWVEIPITILRERMEVLRSETRHC